MNQSYKSQLNEYLSINNYKYENLTPFYEFKIYGRKYTDKNEKVYTKKINGRTIWYIE